MSSKPIFDLHDGKPFDTNLFSCWLTGAPGKTQPKK